MNSEGVSGERHFFMVCSHVSFAAVGDKLTELDVKLVKSLLYSAFSLVGTPVIFSIFTTIFFPKRNVRTQYFFVAHVDLRKP